MSILYNKSSSTRGTWIEIEDGIKLSRKAFLSSSTRGTWIEINLTRHKTPSRASSSTRGTWIEMDEHKPETVKDAVVLHTGDVD